MSNSIDTVMDRSLVRFYAGIRTDQTRKDYQRYLKYFLKYAKIKKAGNLLKLKDDRMQQLVEDYVIHLKGSGLSRSYIDGQIAGLELFFAMNDKILNFKKIRKMTPSRKKPRGERPYTSEEIKNMLELTTSLRNKAVISLFASTGCRVGAIPALKLQDVSEMPDGCKCVIFYRGEPEEYIGFLTPEASRTLDLYLQKRRSDRESLSPDSPLFRESYTVGSGKVTGITLKAVRNMICDLVIKILGKTGRNNHRETAMTHAFRKRFNTVLKNNREINIAVAEKLMGHATRLIPLDTVYHSPNKEVLFTEFRKAIPELTIDESERLRLQVQKQQEVIKKTESEKDIQMKRMGEETSKKIADLESKIDQLAQCVPKYIRSVILNPPVPFNDEQWELMRKYAIPIIDRRLRP